MKRQIVIIIVLIIASGTMAAVPISLDKSNQSYLSETQTIVPTNPPGRGFSFLSLFSNGGNYSSYGWKLAGGNKPVITGQREFNGLPSLEMQSGCELISTPALLSGNRLLSFHFAINARNGTGNFAVLGSSLYELFSIDVRGDTVTVENGGSSSIIHIPSSLISDGWIYLLGTAFENVSSLNGSWVLQLFVNNTISPLQNISLGNMSGYNALSISCYSGTIYFSDLLFTSDQVASFIPGYNSMEGYGQGSGNPAALIGPFTILHANAILYNWSAATFAALSFQINALNYEAAVNPTPDGFFQVGVDLDPAGTIAPWYVGGTNAVANYYPDYSNPDFMPGFFSPAGTKLSLTIQYLPLGHVVLFQVVDYSVKGPARYWNATVQYSGPPFYAAYTQLELSSSANAGPDSYSCRILVYNMTYGNSPLTMVPFSQEYALPYYVNTPYNWNMSPYNTTIQGYLEYF